MRLRLFPLVVAIAVAVPVGALAAQAKTFKFEATLLGKSESPKGASKGKGSVSITITGIKVCWKYTKLSGIDKPVVSHIHRGGAKVASGPVVVPLGGAFRSAGCTTSTAAIVKAIEKNPAGFYVNVHTAKFPNGAIRGQLRPA